MLLTRIWSMFFYYLCHAFSPLMCAVKPVCKLDLFCGQLAQSLIELNCKRSLVVSPQSCHMVMKLSCARQWWNMSNDDYSTEKHLTVWIACLFQWMVRKSGDLLGGNINSACSWEPLSDHTWPFLQMSIHWYLEMYWRQFRERTDGGIYANLPGRKDHEDINWDDSLPCRAQ